MFCNKHLTLKIQILQNHIPIYVVKKIYHYKNNSSICLMFPGYILIMTSNKMLYWNKTIKEGHKEVKLYKVQMERIRSSNAEAYYFEFIRKRCIHQLNILVEFLLKLI